MDYKSKEFWLQVGVLVSGVLVLVGVELPPVLADNLGAILVALAGLLLGFDWNVARKVK